MMVGPYIYVYIFIYVSIYTYARMLNILYVYLCMYVYIIYFFGLHTYINNHEYVHMYTNIHVLSLLFCQCRNPQLLVSNSPYYAMHHLVKQMQSNRNKFEKLFKQQLILLH